MLGSSLNVAVIDGDVPYPTNSGKRLRSLNLVLPLARRHRITYIARCASAAAGHEAADYLSRQGIHPIMVEAPLPAKNGVGFLARLAQNLASPLPYSVSSHFSGKMRVAVAAHAATEPVDLWQLEWSGYRYCTQGLQGPTVMQAHNVDSLIWQRYAETEPNILKRAFLREQWRKMHRFEQRAFQSVTRIVSVSEPDAEMARKEFGTLPIDVVDNGVDVGFFRDVLPDRTSHQVLFLGALDWRPNIDAIAVLLDKVFPLLRARVPQASLAIVGRSPSQALAARIDQTPGVVLHADVPDVRPHMAASAAMAVPLRVGGGSRLKIIEALAAGLPVVSSAVGAEGLHIVPGTDYRLADTPEQMADALVAILRTDRPTANEMDAVRARVAQRYDWPLLAERLEQTWLRAAARL